MENHHFLWENQLYMAMFNSYVSLPEGIAGCILGSLGVSGSGAPLIHQVERNEGRDGLQKRLEEADLDFREGNTHQLLLSGYYY
jgi:hypothetical protein